MECHVHDLKWVAVWIDGRQSSPRVGDAPLQEHCFMLRRCSGCRQFAVGFTYTRNEPFRNSINIDLDQVPVDKLRELQTFVSRIPPERVAE